MKDKKVYSILIIATLIFGVAITAVPTMAGVSNSIYGYLYINDELAPSGIEVKLTFDEDPQPEHDITDSNGHYAIDWMGEMHDYEDGYFYVYYKGEWREPVDNKSVEIEPGETFYSETDLHIEIGNKPPDKPTLNSPADGSTIGSETSATLKVDVTDPDGDTMDVKFYNANGDVYIGEDSGVTDGGTASFTWSGRTQDTTYQWYTVADDGEYTNQSDTWSFTTKADTGGNGGNGGNGGYTPTPTKNQNPVADANGPYSGFIDEEITFDGSNSSDSDGTITNYTWDFGDNTTGYGVNPTHTYDTSGEYTTVLTVTDNDGATDTDETTVNILVPNIPPEKPTVTGTHEGNITTTYEFTFMSTDADNDSIQYTVGWGDGSDETTDFVPNGTQVTLTHTWSVAGNYTIKVTAYDNDTHSDIAEYLVSIEEEKEPVEPEEEYDYTWLILLLILIIILLILIYLISKRKKPEEKKQPPKKTGKTNTNKTPAKKTGNKSKKPVKKTGKTNKKPAKKTGKK